MKRHHPRPCSDIDVSNEIYGMLALASAQTGFELEDWEIAALAIREWIAKHNPDALGMPITAGYQWKQVFLPNGTLLRTVYRGKNQHCMVENDRLVHEGVFTTPNAFANALGGHHRNAWNAIWILFPRTTDWKLAAHLRKRGPSVEKRPGR